MHINVNAYKGLPVTYNKGLYRLRFKLKESNMLIVSDNIKALKLALNSTWHHRRLLEDYIRRDLTFLYALNPVKVKPDMPTIVKLATEAAEKAEVGPMAAIPGALAELVARDIKPYSRLTAMVENGGEIFAYSKKPLNIGVYAGFSPVSGRFGFRLEAEDFPIGIATSSATVSHALSFGEADAVVVFSDSSALADAAATAICNSVRGEDVEASVQRGLEKAEDIEGLRGILIVRNNYVGVVGKLPKFLNIKGNLEEMFKAGRVVLL